jgi:hypothetical protein
MNGVVLGIGLVFFIRPGRDHVLEVGDGLGAATTEVFECAAVVEAVCDAPGFKLPSLTLMTGLADQMVNRGQN